MRFDTGESWFGVRLLALGWSGFFVGQFAWFANFLLFTAWAALYCRARKVAFGFAIVALLLASQTWALFGQQLPADEGGVNHFMLTAFLPGCYVWMASMAAAVIASLWPPRGLH